MSLRDYLIRNFKNYDTVLVEPFRLKIKTNSTNISQLQSDVNQLVADVAKNKTDISSNSTSISTNSDAISILNGTATTKGSVLNTVTNQINQLNFMTKEIVSSLPPVSNAKKNTIYFLKKGNTYEQYVLDDGVFASVGSSLSNTVYDELEIEDWINILGYKCIGIDSTGNTINLIATPIDNLEAFGIPASNDKYMNLKAIDSYTTSITATIDVSDYYANGETINIVNYDGEKWVTISSSLVTNGFINI